MACFHLAYTSASTGLPGEDELQAILAASRRNNARDGLTGMLLYHDGSFFQVLEGSETAVRDCYQRIMRDSRHKSCLQLLSEETGQRWFRDWSMGYIAFEDLSPELQETFFDLLEFRRPDAMAAAVGEGPAKILVRSFLTSFGSQFAA